MQCPAMKPEPPVTRTVPRWALVAEDAVTTRPDQAVTTSSRTTAQLGTDVPTEPTVKATEPSLDDAANVTADSFSYGGPGTGSCQKK